LGIDPKHFTLSFGYEFGANFIVKDRLLLNLGAKLNLPLSPRILKYVLSEEGPWDPYSNVNDKTYSENNIENFKTLAVTRQAFHSFFMIYVGVGLLP
jgi:hypothetical protein